MIPKALYLIICPLLLSCEVKWCSYLELGPENQRIPNKPSPIEEMTESYRDGTEGWKIIDKDYTRLA